MKCRSGREISVKMTQDGCCRNSCSGRTEEVPLCCYELIMIKFYFCAPTLLNYEGFRRDVVVCEMFVMVEPFFLRFRASSCFIVDVLMLRKFKLVMDKIVLSSCSW